MAQQAAPNAARPRLSSKGETLAEKTGMGTKQFDGVFAALGELIGEELKKGPGQFVIPGPLISRWSGSPRLRRSRGGTRSPASR